jgi:ADP-heptose:LPS heptosyltransferase/GT2 family glycosyltransferase
VSDQPKSIVYIRPDTIGDLVIFSSALAELQNAWPEARHTLVVRRGYETLAPLFSPALKWLVAPINPFTEKPGACREALAATLESIRALEPDLILAPTLNRTWLEAAIGNHFPQARRVALGAGAVDPLFVNTLKLELGIDPVAALGEIVAADPAARDWENNHKLVDHLLQRPSPRSFPSLHVPSSAREEAAEWLAKCGFKPHAFLALFPAGLANVPIKAWPYPKFGELIASLQATQADAILLLGHASEADLLREVADQVVAHGGTRPAVWLGQDGQVPQLAAILAQARAYIGHDTGAMHIAAAVGRPTLGIFGGGHWPRFRPVGPQTISVVQPMPCFGCNWDCRFGDAPCVKLIPTTDVQHAVAALLGGGTADFDTVFETRVLSDETFALVDAVDKRYGALQSDRLQRQYRIEELKREANSKDDEIDSLKRESNTKDDEIGSLKKETTSKDEEIEEKDVEIADLKRAADERKREMEAIKAELEAECAQKDTEIGELKAEANTKDAEIAALKDTCNERERLIMEQDQHIRNFQAMVVQLRSDVSEREGRLAAREAELKRLQDIFAKLPEDAENWARIFNDKDVHIKNIEDLLQQRDRELSSARASLDNYASGYAALEQVKFYSKLLAEKEAVVQTLHRACVEREAVIQQLALDAAGPLGRMNKLRFATKKHVQLKFWAPFNDWLFRKVVEDYWMQIGVLKHYDPRPLQWEEFPRKKLPDAKLPKFGIVTPSYGQAAFIGSTMLSVLNQQYPKLYYVVQDGGSKDDSAAVIARYADRLHHWESVKDKGQADAIRKGFAHLETVLGPDDLMGWLNSDDFISPRALRFVAEYFVRHPEVDAVYGHRIIIDAEDRDIGRWIMPRHDPKTLEWIDYVPQETLFWRKRIWDRVGGIDPSFQFALDWDLLARFQQAQAKIVRLPYFLGCFRVHRDQKTSQHIHTVGNEEMLKIRSRFHGERHSDFQTINRFARKARFTGALTARLAAMGIRY